MGEAAVLDFTLDRDSDAAPYAQLRDAVIAGVREGSLLPGAKLPTVRALAESTGLAANTVAHAYRVLEAAGVTEGRGRAGTFVSLAADDQPAAREAASAFVRRARELGIDEDRAHALVADAFAATSG